MNSYHRLERAAERKGWEVTAATYDRTCRVYFNEPEKMLVQVNYTGYLVHSALLYDGRDDCEQFLTTKDRDKAHRIEDVLLGNGRRF